MRFYNYDRKKAGQILENARWRLGDDGIRVKDGRRLSIELIAQSTASRRKVVPFLVKVETNRSRAQAGFIPIFETISKRLENVQIIPE